MARGVSEAAQNAARAGVVRPALFLDIDFDSGPWRSWTGYGDLTINGRVYRGTGDLLKVTLPGESADFTAHPITAELSGVNQEIIALALAEPYQNRPVTVSLGFFDDQNNLISFDIATRGRLDVLELREDGENPTIGIAAETRLRDLQRTLGFYFSDQDQQDVAPGDRGFEFVAQLADNPPYWGTKDVST